MNNKVTVLQEMSSSKLIAVLRSDSVEKAEKTAEACVKGGIRLIEITFSVPNADDVIKNLVAAHQGQNVIVGAGTVLDVQTARAAVNAPLPDVRFLVTGGIGVSNLSEWIKAGAVCAGIGGNLTTVKDGNYDQVTKLAQQYCQIISESR